LWRSLVHQRRVDLDLKRAGTDDHAHFDHRGRSREALEEPIVSIVDAVKATLDKTPPELAADIMEEGITLAGGGALLNGLDQRIANETGMPIRVCDNPLYAVALGAGQSLDEFGALQGVLRSSQSPL
jgi:rod shape-determining protein MreB